MILRDRILDLWHNMKVKKQLMGIYILVILIPILIIGVYLTRLLCDMVVEKSINEASINIERIKERLNEKIRIATVVAENLYVDEHLKDILSTEYDNQQSIIDSYNNAQEISTYLKHYVELSSIRIYTTNTTLLNNSHFIQVTPEIQDSKWYQEAIQRGSQMEWYYKYDEYKKQYYIALIRCIKDRKNNILGVLTISLDTNQLGTIIKDEPYDTMIVFNGDIVTDLGDSTILEREVDHIRKLKVAEEKNFKLKTESTEGEGYVIFTSYKPVKVSRSEIEICMYMTVKNITGETRKIIAKSLGIILVSTLLACLLIISFIRRFSERIILVKGEMAKVVEGNFDIMPSISGNDEIGELYEDIFQTVESVRELVKEVYEAKIKEEEFKRRQKEMQFEMLASQINPHFLYNTLETIRMKAVCSGEAELAKVVKMLSKLLRRNLEVSERSVTISSEIEMMNAYLAIQKFRFGERITYEIKCEIDGSKYKILPLLLQPVIENAFIHGLERKLGVGYILCQIFTQDNFLKVIVEDNGLGMTKERLEQITAGLENNKVSEKIDRLGLRNINERIKIYYGEAYGITIVSEVDKGTKVTVTLPLVGGQRDESFNY